MTNEEARKEIQRWLDGCPWADTKEAFELAITALKNERPKGEWDKRVIQTPNYRVTRFFCSECGKNEENYSKFCPNCGADMRSTEGITYG